MTRKLLPCLLLALLGACAAETPADDPVEPKLSSIQAKIFKPTCTGSTCHSNPGAAAGLALDAADVHAQLVGADSAGLGAPGWKRVVPGKPEESLLYRLLLGKVAGTKRMPAVGDELSAARKEAVRQWIAAGGADD